MFNRFANHERIVKRNNCVNLSKYIAIFSFFIFVFAFFNNMNNYVCYSVSAEQGESVGVDGLEKTVEDLLENINFDDVDLNIANSELGLNLFNGLSFKEYVALIIKGEEVVDLSSFFDLFFKIIARKISGVLHPLLIILVLVLLCNMFNSFKSNKVSGVGEVVYFICFSVSVIIISKLLSDSLVEAKNSIGSIQKQMNLIFPIIMSLITAIGGVVSVKAYTPLLAFLTETISNIFSYVLLPLFSVSLILSIMGNISENVKLDKLNGFIKSLFKWIIGVVFAVFMSFLSLKGIIAGGSDGLSIKATKYAIKNYIPMLGGYISEGFDVIKAGSVLIKNATGFVSILLLFSIIIKPVLMAGVLELGLKLLAGITEPVGNKKFSNMLASVAGSLKLLITIVVGIALMYFLSIFLLICSASNFI